MWEAIDEGARLYGTETWSKAGWHWRATALALPDGGSLVIGPLRGMHEGEAAASLEELAGPPTLALAPNYFHYMALPALRERYPEMQVCCAEPARARLAKKEGGDYQPLDTIRERLPDHARLLEPPGTKSGEAWLRVETDRGVAWVVSDAFFNLEKNARGFTGFMLRITGTAPGLRIGRTFTGFLAMRDKRTYREWLLAELDADPPSLLIPGHGACLAADDLGDRLRALAERRL